MADMVTAPAPSSVLVWHPTELSEESTDETRLSLATCLSTTAAGTRGVVYRSTQDQGIVGIFDYLSDAQPHPDMGWAAYGYLRRINPFLPRAELVNDDILRPTFTVMRGRKGLPPRAGERLLDLLPTLPNFSQATEPLPGPDEHWRWIPVRQGQDWGVEKAMRDALARHRPSWRKIGFTTAPATEVYPPGSPLRMDIAGPGVVVECKVVLSGLGVLRQLDGYLALCRADSDLDWRGHIVVAAGYTTELAKAVAARPDISLWECHRGLGGRPRLRRPGSR